MMSVPVTPTPPPSSSFSAPGTPNGSQQGPQRNYFPIGPHPQAQKWSLECIEAGFHTPYFNVWRHPKEGEHKVISSDPDDFGKLTSRFASMQMALGNHKEYLLYNHTVKFAKKKKDGKPLGFYFRANWHKTKSGSKNNNSTTMWCAKCGGGVSLTHIGLPAEKAPKKLINKVNLAFSNYIFSQAFIIEKKLRKPQYCALENINPGTYVVDEHPDDDDDNDWELEPEPEMRDEEWNMDEYA